MWADFPVRTKNSFNKGRVHRFYRWSTALVACALLGIELQARPAEPSGRIIAIGLNHRGQTDVPAGLTGVKAVAGGMAHSLALTTNGTVVAWGSNEQGERNVPAGLNNVKAIAASAHSVALKHDGTVVVWGANGHPAITTPPPEVTGITAIAAGSGANGNIYTLALRADGKVFGWGIGGQETNVPSGLTGVVGIAAGSYHGLALKSDGTVVGWGLSDFGQTIPPPNLTGVKLVRAGQSSSFAVKTDGTVVKWGGNDGNNPPAGLKDLVDLRLGNNHAFALKSDGTVVLWGGGGVDTTTWGGVNGVFTIGVGASHNMVVTRAPKIESASASATRNPGENVTFMVVASGVDLKYLWSKDGTALSQHTNATLVVENIQVADAGTYIATVSNPFGSANSPPMTLNFPPPVISTSPQSQTAIRGGNVSFSVAANGVGPLEYQWLKDNVEIAEARESTYQLTAIRADNAGQYHVIVTDAVGATAISGTADLTIIDPTKGSVAVTPAIDMNIVSAGGNPKGIATILAGRRDKPGIGRGLLKFTLPELPAGATLIAAELKLTVVQAPLGFPIVNFTLHRMLKDWNETATWEVAKTGDPWAFPGGQAGGGYVATASSTQSVAGPAVYSFGPSTLMLEDVRGWMTDPASNKGWLLRTENESIRKSARHFGSNESANKPELVLHYASRAPAPELLDVDQNANQITLSLNGAAGWFYRLEFRPEVDHGEWQTIMTVPAGTATAPVVLTAPLSGAQGFFRVAVE